MIRPGDVYYHYNGTEARLRELNVESVDKRGMIHFHTGESLLVGILTNHGIYPSPEEAVSHFVQTQSAAVLAWAHELERKCREVFEARSILKAYTSRDKIDEHTGGTST